VFSQTGRAMAEHTLGHADESRAALDDLTAKYAQIAAYQIAQVQAWRGDKDQAFEWLRRAHAQRDGGLGIAKADPQIASLRQDARWPALLKSLGLPE